MWTQTFQHAILQESHLITQAELNNLLQDLDLSKTKAQLFGSLLKTCYLLEKSVIISFYRKRQSITVTYYSMDGDLVYCNKIRELMGELQLQKTPEKWKFFTDSPKVSLKAVFIFIVLGPVSLCTRSTVS